MQSQYPEHDKLKAVKEQSQWLGEFLSWAQEQGWSLREYSEETEEWYRVRKDTNQILAEYLHIDLNKLEQEKEDMLETIRTLQTGKIETTNWVEKDGNITQDNIK